MWLTIVKRKVLYSEIWKFAFLGMIPANACKRYQAVYYTSIRRYPIVIGLINLWETVDHAAHVFV